VPNEDPASVRRVNILPVRWRKTVSEKSPLSERVQESYRQLYGVAADLNAISDELGKSIQELDAALKKLNLGVSVWVLIRGGNEAPEDPAEHWSEELGYAKVGGKWGIALRTISGNYAYPERDDVEAWLFNDAPRHLRLSAIGKIPELLDALSKEAAETSAKIMGKLAEAQEVAAAVKSASEPLKRVLGPMTRPPVVRAVLMTKPTEVKK
jgi:hypothetical protein